MKTTFALRMRPSFYLKCFIALSLVCGGKAADLSPLDYWRWNNPRENGNYINSIAFGNNRYLAVGDWGTVLISEDGCHWRNRSLLTPDFFGCICFGRGIFVAYLFEPSSTPVGISASYLLTSIDGENWGVAYSKTNASIYGRTGVISKIIFADGQFVAVGGNESPAAGERGSWVLTSTNGSDWCIRQPDSDLSLFSVAYANNKYVAVGVNRISMVSSNALDWEVCTTNDLNTPSQWVDIIFENEKFTVLANNGFLDAPSALINSVDGRSWQSYIPLSDFKLRGISKIADTFVVAGQDGKAMTSLDGTHWSSLLLPTNTEIYSVKTIRGTTFMLGSDGVMLSTTNLTKWQTIPDRLGLEFVPQSFDFDRNVFVGFGCYGASFSSVDGQNWSIQTNSTSATINSITHDREKFVAVGYDHNILVSSNGQDWRIVYSDPSPRKVLSDVDWNGSLFVAVGWYGYTLTSADGLEWQVHQPTNNFFQTVTASKDLFVASMGVIVATSTDGIDWSVKTNLGLMTTDGVYASGRFVLVGELGRAFVSTNGSEWTPSVILDGWNMRRIISANDYFVASGDGGLIFTSKDGLTWQPHHLPAVNRIFAIAFGHDKIIAGGNRGMLLESDNFSGTLSTIRGLTSKTGDRLELELLTQPNSFFEIDETSDLVNWSPISFLPAALGRATYITEKNSSARFFRAIPRQ